MTREARHDLQTLQDIGRAELAIALARGVSREESAEALRYDAAVRGLSIHATALAVLSTEPTDDLLSVRGALPPPSRRRHLYALAEIPADDAVPTGDAAAPPPRRGRHRRR